MPYGGEGVGVLGGEGGSAAAFNIFVVDIAEGGAVKVAPFEGPEVFRTGRMGVGLMAVDKDAGAGSQREGLAFVGKYPLSFADAEKEVGGEGFTGADVGASSRKAADLLQMEEAVSCKP